MASSAAAQKLYGDQSPFHTEFNVGKRKRVELIRTSLKTEMEKQVAHWRDLADYFCPRRPRFTLTDRNSGDRRNQKIIDSTGVFARRVLQSGMHAGMTSPARPWMFLTTPDPDLAEFGPVKEWLYIVTQRMLNLFRRTNLYNMLPVHYGDMSVFASAATGMFEDDEELFRTYSYPIGSFGVATNHRGQVNQFYYDTKKTVMEIVEQFLLDRRSNMIDWRNASQALRNCWDRGSYNDFVDVSMVIAPNMEYEPGKLHAKYRMKFASCTFEMGQDRDDKFLKESGYNEFPILFSRWDVTGEDWWGTDSPGMIALGDNKQMQTGEKRSLQAVEKQLNPPLQAPTHVRNQKASLLPGDITYTDVREGQKGIHPIHETNVAIDQLEAKQQSTRYRVQRAFYEDLFMMLSAQDPMRSKQPITARQVAEHHEEKLISLGPVLERTNDELLDRLAARAYAMMERDGQIPPPPEELHNVKLRVEFTSILAQAQKLVGVIGAERLMTNASILVQAGFTDVRHKLDTMQMIDDFGDMLGVNPKAIRPTEEARRLAKAEADAMIRAAQAQALKDTTGAVKNLADSPVGGDEGESALDRIAAGMGQ